MFPVTDSNLRPEALIEQVLPAYGLGAIGRCRLHARGIGLVMLENSMLQGLPHQPDGQHLTPEGYRMLAESVATQVASAIGR